jgi:hypothetical protein
VKKTRFFAQIKIPIIFFDRAGRERDIALTGSFSSSIDDVSFIDHRRIVPRRKSCRYGNSVKFPGNLVLLFLVLSFDHHDRSIVVWLRLRAQEVAAFLQEEAARKRAEVSIDCVRFPTLFMA